MAESIVLEPKNEAQFLPTNSFRRARAIALTHRLRALYPSRRPSLADAVECATAAARSEWKREEVLQALADAGAAGFIKFIPERHGYVLIGLDPPAAWQPGDNAPAGESEARA